MTLASGSAAQDMRQIRDAYHFQTIGAIKPALTRFTVMFRVTNVPHVLLDRALCMECLLALSAWDPRSPMILGVHVLLACTLTAESLFTGVAFRPVISIVHVIVASILGEEALGTSGTFNHDWTFRAGLRDGSQ